MLAFFLKRSHWRSWV